MAAKITHLEVLKQTAVLLEHGSEVQQELARHIGAPHLNRYANLGSIAPDIFYFYHILSKKKNARAQIWGNLSHHSRVLELVLYFLDRIRESPPGLGRDKQLAFALGYICHCVVDVVTHPFIFYFTGDYYSEDEYEATEAQQNHLRVEYALDAFLIHHRWGIHPHRYNYLQYVDCREKLPEEGTRNLDFDIWSLWCAAFAAVFPEEFSEHYYGLDHRIVEDDIINESYLGFLKFNRRADTRFRSARFLMRTLDRLTFHKLPTSYLILPPPDSIDPRIPNEQRRGWAYPADPERKSTESFMDLIHRAAQKSAEVMERVHGYLNGSVKRKELEKQYAGFNLDTGLRSESIKMTSFSVLREDQ